jgi:hypothetical protein
MCNKYGILTPLELTLNRVVSYLGGERRLQLTPISSKPTAFVNWMLIADFSEVC